MAGERAGGVGAGRWLEAYAPVLAAFFLCQDNVLLRGGFRREDTPVKCKYCKRVISGVGLDFSVSGFSFGLK